MKVSVPPRFSKIMSKMRDDEDTQSDIPLESEIAVGPRAPETMRGIEDDIIKPFPPGVAMQEAYDDMLQRRVVDPLYGAGHEDLGAGLAAVSSAAHSMIVPQTNVDVAGTIIPLPGIAKLMKKGKFRKISKAMHVEDPENAAEIIAKQAGKVERPATWSPEDLKAFGQNGDEGDTVKQISKSKDDMLKRSQKEKMEYETYKIAQEKKPTSYHEGSTFKGGFANYDNPEEILKQYNDAIKSPPNNTYVGSNISESFTVDPAKGVGPARQMGIDPSHMAKTTHIGSGVELGNPDPLTWLDVKFGTTKSWLQQTKGTPRLIETQSDLIAHDEYMENLMPGDRVVLHIFTDNGSFSRLLSPGSGSPSRVLKAAQKLAKAGIDVKIVKNTPDTLRTLPDYDIGEINAKTLKGSGIKFEERNLALDDAQESRLRKMLGLESMMKKKPKVDPKDDMFKADQKAKMKQDPANIEERLKVVEPPKPPKGDPEASLPRQPDKFSRVRSQLDVAPARMDERGKAFGDVGQSDFTPYDRPSPEFEEIRKRNYVERDVDPKEKLWKEIVASDPYLPDSPEYLQNLRNYFDNRWEQAQGTAEGGQIRMDLPKADRVKLGADLGVTSRYADELAFKKFAKPYDKTRQSERPLLGPNDRTNKIDDKITDHFEGYEVSTPGRKLQNEMYKGRPSHEAEQAKLFPKVKEAVKGKVEVREKFRIVRADNGKDVTRAYGSDENLAGLTQKELQDMVDPTGKKYRVVSAVTPE